MANDTFKQYIQSLYNDVREIKGDVKDLKNGLIKIYNMIDKKGIGGTSQKAKSYDIRYGGFTIKNMTDSQAKDLLTQGLSPEQVHILSGEKLTVQYLVNMKRGLK